MPADLCVNRRIQIGGRVLHVRKMRPARPDTDEYILRDLLGSKFRLGPFIGQCINFSPVSLKENCKGNFILPCNRCKKSLTFIIGWVNAHIVLEMAVTGQFES